MEARSPLSGKTTESETLTKIGTMIGMLTENKAVVSVRKEMEEAMEKENLWFVSSAKEKVTWLETVLNKEVVIALQETTIVLQDKTAIVLQETTIALREIIMIDLQGRTMIGLPGKTMIAGQVKPQRSKNPLKTLTID
jgi:hypothetical protein